MSSLNDVPDQDLFDRLVDGELGDAEQDDLLRHLDTDPDGWRRLALAFVEEQRWNRELSQLVAEQTKPASVDRPQSEILRRRERIRISMLWPTAVSVTVSFLLGLAVGGAAPAGNDGRQSGPMAQQQAVSVEASGEERPPGSRSPRDTVLLHIDDPQTDQRRQWQVPVIDADEAGRTLLADASALPELVRQVLQSTGHRVVEERKFYPLQLEDGRRVALPVDEVQVQYVGYRAYQ